MSGIAGIIRFDGAPVAPGLVEKMTAAMVYRGPDGIHHCTKGPVALGQCMLRTTPESLEETQPLANEDESLVLVMDGRVDNWEELRRELLGRGAILRTRADAELVLRAYEAWGRECLAHIDGDFALVIWDARRQEAFCARDRMGNKPLQYHWDGKIFAFASELHPILALPWVREEPNEGMLAEFLATEWHSRDETLWLGIMRLVAAHAMRVDAGGPHPERYWAPELWATLPCTTDEEYIEHYRELFTDAVRRMSRSHRPLACDVSGGLDSSAVFCLAEHLRRNGRLLAPGIEGYTLAFAKGCNAYELDYARAVGDFLSKPIHEIPPTIPSLDWYEEQARTNKEFPAFPNGSMHSGSQRQAAADGSLVVLGGEWGDALLQGSRAYYAEELAQGNFGMLYKCFRKDASVAGSVQATKWFIRHGLIAQLPVGLAYKLRWLMQHFRKRNEFPEDLYWLSQAMRDIIFSRRDGHRSTTLLKPRRHCQRALQTTLNDAFVSIALEQTERLATQSAIETRQPLGDPRLVQFAFSTPERLRLRGNRTKYIHVEAMRGLMPQTILNRRTKGEFSIVFHEHLDATKKYLTDKLPMERPDWVDAAGVARLFGFYQNHAKSGWPIWVLWTLYGCDRVFKKSL